MFLIILILQNLVFRKYCQQPLRNLFSPYFQKSLNECLSPEQPSSVFPPLCLFFAGIREGDPMGDSYRCGFIRPGWYITHLSPHRCYGFLGLGWRNSLHYDVPAAGLCALLQHLKWLRRRCWLLGRFFLKTFVWRALAQATTCPPFPRMHLWRRCLHSVCPHQDHLYVGFFCHHIAGLRCGFCALQQRTDTSEVGRVSNPEPTTNTNTSRGCPKQWNPPLTTSVWERWRRRSNVGIYLLKWR